MPAPTVKPIPEGMRSLTPHLVCDGAAAAIEFYKKAFGAVEEARMATPDGRLAHAQVRIGDSALMLVDEFPEMGAVGPKKTQGSPVTIHLYVPDVDATVAQAVAAGAELTMPVTEMFWGDRFGTLKDPFGHSWSVATHVRDLTPEQIAEGMGKMGG
ncbi:VOC family protein [Aquincola sp. S2]|uniref:VOC family protein n=1 Tax=Pseudaquabacterium terrae TaxID=2732868 RepID=A0ABX2ESX2_9BURK|nr:VOC family protein [Aquabacterium terrae]NRF71810.1 VOC family protein [Aquabacterium terrae]